ncbi:MAG: CPBP family intramembrane glutamic endopeptidase [Myxococcota bacterium]
MRALGLRTLVFFYGLMGVLGLGFLWSDNALNQVFPRLPPLIWCLHLSIGVGVGLAVVAASRWATARFVWARQLSEEFRNLLGDMGHREIVVAAILSGFSEELLFRGVLQPALGLWIASAVFALMHIGPNRRFVPWTLMALGVGMLFGGLFYWTDSLVAPMVAHMVVNFLNLRFLTQRRVGAEISLEPLGGDRVTEC